MNRKLLVVILLLFELVARAQTTSISGTVVDSSQALIPGVTIEIENLGTGQKRTTVTDEGGRFTLLGVPPGKFHVTASLPGFQTWRQQIEVGSGGAQLSIMLQIA